MISMTYFKNFFSFFLYKQKLTYNTEAFNMIKEVSIEFLYWHLLTLI